MADETSDKQGSGGTLAVIIGVVAVVTFGFNVLAFVLSQQGKLEDKQDRLSETKADKEQVAAQASDRYTGAMAEMEKTCGTEKEILRAQRETLRDEVNDKKIIAARWESKFDDCESRWLLHMKICKCSEHPQGEI